MPKKPPLKCFQIYTNLKECPILFPLLCYLLYYLSFLLEMGSVLITKRYYRKNHFVGKMTYFFYSSYFHVSILTETSKTEMDIPYFEIQEILRTREMFTFKSEKNIGYFLLCDGSFDADGLERFLSEHLPLKFKRTYK